MSNAKGHGLKVIVVQTDYLHDHRDVLKILRYMLMKLYGYMIIGMQQSKIIR